MNMECKGIKYRSLLKYCFIGIFISSIIIAISGTIGGYFYTDDWNGPKATAGVDITLMGEIYVKDDIDTSVSANDLLKFLIGVPLSSLIMAIFIWLLFLIGQSIYSYFYTMKLTLTDRGLSLFSSIKYCTIGFFWSLVPLSIITSLIYSRVAPEPSTIKFNGEPIGAIGETIILAIACFPMGAIYGTLFFLGSAIYSLYKPLILELKLITKDRDTPSISGNSEWQY